MYNGNNPIALKSRQWLIDALISLMKEHPYSKISIKDICKKADLSRQSFYNFFNEKDDILHFCLRKYIEEKMDKLVTETMFQMNDLTSSFLEFFEENAVILQLMVNQHLEAIIAEEISVTLYKVASIVTTNSTSNLSKYGNAFLTGALTQVLIFWFKDTQRISPEQLSELLLEILYGQYYQI